MEGIIVDGNDADEVYAVAQTCLAAARAGEGPALVEAKTYRQGGHSRADPGKYRPAEEVDEWLARDPIPKYRERLLSVGVDGAELNTIEQESRDKVERATEAARSAPPPDLATLETQVWADGGSSWRS
ncbi:MAG: thiamine pyrophosphate-dependent enzyme [Acidimicrobiia bacterium]